MRWYHESSLDWLAARNKYLTASQIAKLVPYTPTGRARDVSKVKQVMFASKTQRVLPGDQISTGAAARGHILEPYAIEAFNSLEGNQLYHWDDMIIHNGILGWSPDALGQPMPDRGKVEVASEEITATYFGEVKSYDAISHYGAGLEDKMKLEERWQMATAFTVCPTLEKGYLIFFNPKVKDVLFVHPYTRDDLEEEIKIIGEVSQDYATSQEALTDQITSSYTPVYKTEEEIIAEQIAMTYINP